MEENKPLISVIVPVYQSEEYLEACLHSLEVQTYTNLEIITVDDASPDNSIRICESFAARDRRFQTVRLAKNQGPSAARNAGIRLAKGAYITFVDSDDYAMPALVEKLYACLLENGADAAACGAEGIQIVDGPAQNFSKEEAICCLAKGSPFNLVPWGKLYDAALVKRYLFPEDIFYSEDLLFLYRLMQRVERVSYIPDRLYRYNCREGSQVQSGLSKRKCTALLAHDMVCQDAAVNHPYAVEEFRQLAMEADRCIAMIAVKHGCGGEPLFPYLKQVQANIRKHFSWKALGLSSSRKNAASILLLYGSAAAFWAVGAAYTRLRRGKEA